MRTWFKMALNGNTAEVAIFGEIGGWGLSAADFKKALDALGKYDKFVLSVNSPGGSVTEGMAIFNMLKDLGKPSLSIITGIAASMGSIIPMACDEVHIHENSYVMIHNPWAGVAGDSAELRKVADLLDSMKNQAITCYSRHCKLDPAELAQLLDAETWLDGKNAVEKGFASKLLPTIDAKASFDLSKFANLPEGAKIYMKAASDTPPANGDTPPDTSAKDENEYSAKLESIAGLLVDAQTKITTLTTENSTLKTQLSDAENKADAAEKRFQNLAAKLESKLGPGFNLTNENFGEIMSWKDALAECGGDYVKARKQFPDAYKNTVKPTR